MAPGLRLGRHFREQQQSHPAGPPWAAGPPRAAGDRAPSSQYCCFFPPRPVHRLVPAEPRPSGSCHAPRPPAPPAGSPPPPRGGGAGEGVLGPGPGGWAWVQLGQPLTPAPASLLGGPAQPCRSRVRPALARSLQRPGLDPAGAASPSRTPDPAVLWRVRGGEAPGEHAHRQRGVSPFCAGQDGAMASPGLGPDPAQSLPALGAGRLRGFFLAQWAAGFSEHNGQTRSRPPRVTT